MNRRRCGVGLDLTPLDRERKSLSSSVTLPIFPRRKTTVDEEASISELQSAAVSHEILHRLECEDRDHEESGRLARLIEIVAGLPVPPNADEHFPEFCRLQQRLRQSISGGSGDELEETFLELYAHLHMHEAPYTSSERRRMDETGGYWSHAGGLSPILKAAPHISEGTVSADLGAGNGLQGLMLQLLYPHARTIQLELSSQMVEGKGVQRPRNWDDLQRFSPSWSNPPGRVSSAVEEAYSEEPNPGTS